ncbi:LuxR C-terminal-related transcriptional regulator [Kitasatospora hibisci]|uniref:helix-turn-helix transcriptional regulator n=1 Tax=Kitasatospora hibisci TaxID=3369522 RepID=UPI0037543BFE
MLELLGLDSVAEAVYRGMLTDPEGGVPELCARLRLPEFAVREALDRLADLTLLRASRARPGALRPVSPERGLRLLLRRQEEELARRQQELAASKAAVARAVAEYATLRTGSLVDGGERLVGLDAIQAKLEALTARLADERLAVLPGGAQSAASPASSRPLDEGAGTGLSAGERELLRLLSTGLTDDAAAKRLGISVRTVRRQMAALMGRLDAASRFEAGLKVAQRGWL